MVNELQTNPFKDSKCLYIIQSHKISLIKEKPQIFCIWNVNISFLFLKEVELFDYKDHILWIR